MATPRAIQIDLGATPYYHCITRCVRRSFLCGKDYETGRDFNHRKSWIISKFKELASIFAIRICAYAVMSNHYHLVLFVDIKEGYSLSNQEVYERWAKLCPIDAKSYKNYDLYDPILNKKIIEWRQRLMNISWFMKFLNEYVARLSNQEDKCKGRFWESRFKSQALLDEGAILGAMAYVDLNPIRAGIANTPETSHFTSIYERIKFIDQQQKTNKLQSASVEEQDKIINTLQQPSSLMSFANSNSIETSNIPLIDFTLSDYLQLVDETGRVLRDDKRGAISEKSLGIISRLNLTPNGWLNMVKDIENKFYFAVGDTALLSAFGFTERQSSPKGLSSAKKCYQRKTA